MPSGPSPNAVECLFCKIVAGDLPADFVAEGEGFVAIRDIRPQAPTHVLILPRAHIASLVELEDASLAGELLLAARAVALQEGLDQGWRLIVNTGEHGRQEVMHLHLHVLGGRSMGRMVQPD